MPKLVTEILRTVEHIASQGITVLLVEQNVFEALQVCQRAYVLQTGRIVMEVPAASCYNATWRARPTWGR